jgi:hypothetical protein
VKAASPQPLSLSTDVSDMARLADAIIPLYWRGSDGFPEPYASGTLLGFGDAGFLATAGHCFESLAEQGVFIPVRSKIVGIDARGCRGAEPFDVACLRLSDEIVSALRASSHFIEPAQIDPDDHIHPGAHYSFVGFPWRQTVRSMGAKSFSQRRHTFSGPTLAPAVMRVEGLNPDVHIAIDFDREKVKRGDGTLQKAPLPEGMSGGAVFNARRTGTRSVR